MYENKLLCWLVGIWWRRSIAFRIATLHAQDAHHLKNKYKYDREYRD